MDLQEVLSADEAYQTYCREYTQYNQHFLEIILTLPKEQQRQMMDYMETVEKMITRIMELAAEE